MRKYFYFFLAMAMLFTTACAYEEEEPVRYVFSGSDDSKVDEEIMQQVLAHQMGYRVGEVTDEGWESTWMQMRYTIPEGAISYTREEMDKEILSLYEEYDLGIFLSGAIFLKSNMTLYLEDGAVLMGSPDTKDYPLMEYRFEGMEKLCYASLVNTKSQTERLSNITIAGPGTINANGEKLFRAEMDEKAGIRGRAVCIRNVDNLYLQDVTVRQSPAWCVHLIYCNNVSINNVQVYTKYDENGVRYKDIFNGDGIDPDSCSNVYIFNSLIASQDDCIAIKSGRDKEGRAVGIPCENIRITDCIFNSGFGVAIGSEMSGGVRNVLVKDCEFNDTFSIGTVKAPRGRGNVIENITYENITHKNFSTDHKDCRWFRGAIYVDQYYSHETFDVDAAEPVDEGTAIIRDITFKDIELETVGGNAVYLAGLPESPLINITLDNVTAKGKRGMKAMNIDGLCMKDVTVVSCEDDAYYLKNVKESKR